MKTLFAVTTLMLMTMTLVGVGCASPSASEEETTEASQDSELRSVAAGFFIRSPLSGARMERLRSELVNADDSGHWVRNQGNSFAMQWDARSNTPAVALTASQRAAVAQAAFGFQLGNSRRAYLKDVKVVAPTKTALGEALDAVGLSPMMAGDAETDAQRTKLVSTLLDAAKTRSITVLSAKLEYQVDMYWEGALVVIDEDNKQILFATGGYGT